MAKKTSPARREAFFRALAETGNQTIAAERAKVSRGWVTRHAREEPEFRAAMKAAIAQARTRLQSGGGMRPAVGWGSLDGEELVVRAGSGRRVQIARARLKQWTPALETRFIDVLAATCNVTAAARAVGLSASSAYDHANRWPRFSDRWQAAVEEGYFRIEMQLLERATRSLSPAGAGAGSAESDDALFHQLHMHQHAVHGRGKAPGREAKLRLEARDEAVAALLRGIERVEARKRRQGAVEVDAAVRAADRREWDRRGAR